jgi:arsenate reductase-like glutaredoxin family protein
MRKDKPDNDRIISVMIGPSGNLRAPTLQVGKTLLIGFNEESYAKVLN